MTPQEKDNDRQIDEMLQRLGPALPEPAASDAVKVRVAAIVGAQSASNGRTDGGPMTTDGDRRGRAWLTIAMAACIAGLGVIVYLSRAEIASLREQVNQLELAAAGDDGLPRDAAPDATDSPIRLISHPRYVVVNMHHQFCPRAAEVTPAFREIEERHTGEKVLFVTLDVTPGKIGESMKLAERLGIKWIFDDTNLETGMVKLLDTTEHRVVLAAIGQDQLPQFETKLEENISTR